MLCVQVNHSMCYKAQDGLDEPPNDMGAHPRALARQDAILHARRNGERSSGAAPSYPAGDAGNDPYRLPAT